MFRFVERNLNGCECVVWCGEHLLTFFSRVKLLELPCSEQTHERGSCVGSFGGPCSSADLPRNHARPYGPFCGVIAAWDVWIFDEGEQLRRKLLAPFRHYRLRRSPFFEPFQVGRGEPRQLRLEVTPLITAREHAVGICVRRGLARVLVCVTDLGKRYQK